MSQKVPFVDETLAFFKLVFRLKMTPQGKNNSSISYCSFPVSFKNKLGSNRTSFMKRKVLGLFFIFVTYHRLVNQ